VRATGLDFFQSLAGAGIPPADATRSPMRDPNRVVGATHMPSGRPNSSGTFTTTRRLVIEESAGSKSNAQTSRVGESMKNMVRASAVQPIPLAIVKPSSTGTNRSPSNR